MGSLQHIDTLSLSSDILYVSKPAREEKETVCVCLHLLCPVTSSIHQYNILLVCVLLLLHHG